MRKNIIYIICLILLCNCSQTKKDKQLQFTEIKDIECIPMEYSDILGTTMEILKIDSLLLVNDFKGDTLIHVYNINTGQVLCKLVPVGAGPGEMISPLNLHLQNNELIIYFRNKRTVYSMPVSDITKKNKDIKKKLALPGDAARIAPLCDSVFVSSGFYQEKRYALINCSGKKTTEFGTYPEFWSAEKNIPYQAKAIFHQCFFLKHPVMNRFVSYSNHVCEIFDYSCNANNEPALVKSILFGQYRYQYINTNAISAKRDEDTEHGIYMADCSSKYIYLVYSPTTRKEQYNGCQIKVIDWEGNPVKQLNCSKKIHCLEIDEKEGKAYVIVPDPDDIPMYFYLDE